MLEQAFEAEGRNAPTLSKAARPAPKAAPAAPAPALEKRLDQMVLAGVTPPHGLRSPRQFAREVPLRLEPPPPVTPATGQLLESLDEGGPAGDDELDITAKLERPVTIDAALQDAVAAAAAEATREIPAQRRQRAKTNVDISVPSLVVPAPVVEAKPVAPAPVEVKAEIPAPMPVVVPAPVLRIESEKKPLPRPPPLPKTNLKRTPPPVVTSAPPPVFSAPAPVLSAPPPRVMQVLGDDVTIPGLSPASSNSSSSGKLLSQSELYRLQLEFEDTPARPLPALASLQPMPLLPSSLGEALERAKLTSGEGPALVEDHAMLAEPMGLAGVESTDLNRLGQLDDLEGIEDLDALARALGLKSVADVSIPSGDGAPVVADDEPADVPPPPKPVDRAEISHIRRAAIIAALGEGDDSFLNGSGPAPTRPALQAKAAAVPVIVRIPSRPKVSAEAREQARKLYLAAVDELSKGDKVGAIGHLKLALHYDDGVQLYRDLLAQLERNTKSDEKPVSDAPTAEAPALMVMKPSGRMTPAKDEWQADRRR
jgi:hypothetical protein